MRAVAWAGIAVLLLSLAALAHLIRTAPAEPEPIYGPADPNDLDEEAVA